MLDDISIHFLEWAIVSLQRAHQIQSCHTLPCVLIDCVFQVFEVTSLDDLIGGFVDFSIYIINLHFMEGMVPHSAGVRDKSALSEAADVLLVLVGLETVVEVIVHVLLERKDWVGLPDDLTWDELALLVDLDDSPVEEAAFPELAEIDADRAGDLVARDDVMWLDLVPSCEAIILASDR